VRRSCGSGKVGRGRPGDDRTLIERRKHTVKRAITRSVLVALAAFALCLCLVSRTSAQQGGTTRYVYDDNGRLHAVIAPSGEAVIYEYDAAGNIASIRRVAADVLTILAFTPHAGIYGDLVTFIGIGFGAGVSDVSFNGTPARIVQVTAAVIVAEVPQGATTGPVTITTPRGSVATTEPFTIRGVSIAPAAVTLKFGETAQFTAQVLPATLDQSVTWSVNGIDGGSSTFGTVSGTGLYTAPNREQTAVIVRATSVVDPLRFAEARVQVRNPDDVQGVFAAAVSVSRGANTGAAPFAAPVAVQRGTLSDIQTAASAPVAVQRGNQSGVNTAFGRDVAVQFGEASGGRAALSAAVAVQRGSTGQVTALTDAPVAVRYGSATEQDTALSLPVTATTGPLIQTITPASLAQGASVGVTVRGANLGAVAAVRFINESGANDTSVVASNVVVSADGTSLTATLTVSSGAALGRRIMVVVTPDGSSQFIDIGTNTINVTAP